MRAASPKVRQPSYAGLSFASGCSSHGTACGPAAFGPAEVRRTPSRLRGTARQEAPPAREPHGYRKTWGVALQATTKSPRCAEETPRAGKRLRALLGVILVMVVCAGPGSCSSTRGQMAQQPGTEPARKGGLLTLEDAQRKADFIVYLPSKLPRGCRLGRVIFVPRREGGRPAPDSLPDQVYMEFGRGLAMWQMPLVSWPLAGDAVPIVRHGRHFWVKTRRSSTSLEWVREGTHLGLSGPLRSERLIEVAMSVRAARPEITPVERPLMEPGGIGVELRFTPERVIVESLLRGSVAKQAGVKPGDIIEAVDGHPVKGAPPQTVISHVRGMPGTKVTITVSRAGKRQKMEMTITRTVVSTPYAVARTTEALRAEMPFRVLVPTSVPPTFQVAIMARLLTRPNPEGIPTRARISWQSGANEGFQITESKHSGRKPWGLGHVFESPHELWLDWIQSGTLVHIEGIGVTPEQLLQLARSLR